MPLFIAPDGVSVYEIKNVYQSERLVGWYLQDQKTGEVRPEWFYTPEQAEAANEDCLDVVYWGQSGKISKYYYVDEDIGWFPVEGI